MPVLFRFLVFSAATLLFAAVLFYPAWLGVSGFADIDPQKVLLRFAKLLAAIGLVFFLKRMGLWERGLLGFGVPRRRFFAGLGAGWVTGILIMAALLGMLGLLDVRTFQPEKLTPSLFAGVVPKAIVAGLAVGLIEETFFRGALFGGIRRQTGLWQAALVSALFYAALHFLRTQPLPAGTPIDWTTGLHLLTGAFDKFASPGIWDSFAALTAAGVLLALLRAWHGSIAVAMGVHAGWVTTIKIAKDITDPVADAPLGFLIGTYDHIIGWLAAAWLLALIVIAARPAQAREAAHAGQYGAGSQAASTRPRS